MNLPELSIRRPVLVVMLNFLIALLGIISIGRIGLDRYPNVEFPIISVVTGLQGASPNLIDSSITQVIESAVNSISDIDYINSTSLPNTSIVTVVFNLSKNLDVAFNEVQAKVSQAQKLLPVNVDLPTIEKLQTGTTPILWLVLQGNRTLQQLNDYASNVVKKRLENVNGVGEVVLGGQRDRVVRINLNPEKMAAYDVSPQDVLNAFLHAHFSLPGGFITVGNTEHLVNLDFEYHDVRKMGDIVVAYRNNAPILLSQVADAEDSLADKRQLAQYNGKPAVGLGIVKITGANTISVIDDVKAKLQKEIIPALPAGMKISVAEDDSFFVRDIATSLQEHIITGTLLASLIVLMFLRDFRSTLIVGLAIPISLLGAIAVMYFSGFTFNVLTLLALLLLIGVVVDDSIVVLENANRTLEENVGDKKTLVLDGTRQVMFAVFASTLTVCSIFFPVIFMQGIIGRFFESFAVVVASGVFISLFVSLTLTPMLCSRYLTVTNNPNKLSRFFLVAFERLEKAYRFLLQYSLKYRWSLLAITLVMFFGSGMLFMNLGKEFSPNIDEGRFLIYFKTPLGSRIDYTENRLNTIEKIVRTHPEVASMLSTIGVGKAAEVRPHRASRWLDECDTLKGCWFV